MPLRRYAPAGGSSEGGAKLRVDLSAYPNLEFFRVEVGSALRRLSASFTSGTAAHVMCDLQNTPDDANPANTSDGLILVNLVSLAFQTSSRQRFQIFIVVHPTNSMAGDHPALAVVGCRTRTHRCRCVSDLVLGLQPWMSYAVNSMQITKRMFCVQASSA